LPLDLSKLTDAVTKVASLAASVTSLAAEREAAVSHMAQAQVDVDALTAQLLQATQGPAEAAGIAAVSAALAPAAAPLVFGTLLPGDPRAV
jgi:hypothetical protein